MTVPSLDCTRSFFTVQIVETFHGTGHRNNKVCPIERAKRLKREEYWMKTLGIIYLDELNKKAKKHDSEVPAGKLFFFIPKTK